MGDEAMKGIRITALGAGIWLSSLIWPEINNLLTSKLIVILGAGLGASVLLYLWQQHLESDHGNNGASQNPRPPLSRDQTGPLPVLRHLS
jgi:hypothetical protein